MFVNWLLSPVLPTVERLPRVAVPVPLLETVMALPMVVRLVSR